MGAKRELNESEKAAKPCERAYLEAQGKHAELQSVLKDKVSPLKETAGTNKSIQSLVKDIKKFEVDASLLSTFPAVAAKAPAERGDFDQLTFDNLERALGEKLNELQGGVRAAEPAWSQSTAKVEQTKHSFAQAKEALQEAKRAWSDADNDVSEAEGDLKKAQKALDGFEAEIKVDEANVSKTRKALEIFQAGPFNAFAELKATVAPVPEPAPVGEALGEGEPAV